MLTVCKCVGVGCGCAYALHDTRDKKTVLLIKGLL